MRDIRNWQWNGDGIWAWTSQFTSNSQTGKERFAGKSVVIFFGPLRAVFRLFTRELPTPVSAR